MNNNTIIENDEKLKEKELGDIELSNKNNDFKININNKNNNNIDEENKRQFLDSLNSNSIHTINNINNDTIKYEINNNEDKI